MIPRDEHIARGSQARLGPTRNIQRRLGSKRRMAEKRGADPGTKTHWGRNGKRKDDCRLDGEEDIGSMLPMRQKRALPKRVWRGAED